MHMCNAFEHIYKEKEGKHVRMKQSINRGISQEEKYIFQDIKLAHLESISSRKISVKGSSWSFQIHV